MALGSLRRFVFALFFLSWSASPLSRAGEARSSVSAAADPIEVIVDGSSAPLSTFLGLGVQFDPYLNPPAPERWRTMLDRVAYARFGFFRVMSSATDYCLGFDGAGAPIYVWQHPTPEGQERLNRLQEILDFAEAHGISVYLGEWSPAHEIGIDSPADRRWPRMIADFVQYLVKVRHYTVVRHYIFFNEPNGDWMWPQAAPDFAAWSAGIRSLRRELDARGLGEVQLAGPDNSGGQDWFERSARELNTEFGSWESHIYATDREVLDGEMERNLAQIARAGWMGADAWDLDDAMHGNGKGGLKIWGFWDSSAADMSSRPWFYTWALISRAFPRGARILKVDSAPSDRFRATAAEWASAAGTQSSVLLVNDSDAPRVVNVKAPTAKAGKIYCFRYFENERPVDGNGLPRFVETRSSEALKKGLSIAMPSRGVVILTTSSDQAKQQ